MSHNRIRPSWRSAFRGSAGPEFTPNYLLNNLIAFWPGDEISGGPALDCHVNALHLDDINTVITGAGHVYATARQYTESNLEYHTRPLDDALLSTGSVDFTLAVWVKLTDKITQYAIVGKYQAATARREYMLDYDLVNDRFRLLLRDASDATTTILLANNLGSPSSGVWYLVVAWHDAVNHTANIQINNGTVDSVEHSGSVPDTASVFRVGAFNEPPAVYMNGCIGPVMFWKSAPGGGGVLTNVQRESLYNSGAGLRYANFDDGSQWNWLTPLVKFGSNPIIANGGGAGWKSTDVGAPNVFYDTPNSRWVMSFGGWGTEGQTGIAYNPDIADLSGWTEEAANPIWHFDAAFGESVMASNGSMCVKDNTYYFAYQTTKGGVARIVLATGASLLTLARANGGAAIPELGSGGQWDEHQQFDPMIRVGTDGTTLELYYAGDNNTGTRGIGWATSTDNGANWTKHGRLLSQPEATAHFGEPTATATGKNLTADNSTVTGYRRSTQYISRDNGVTWHGPVGILNHGGVGDWDVAQVFDAMTVIHGGVAYVFYAGSTLDGGGVGLDMQIGVATKNYP